MANRGAVREGVYVLTLDEELFHDPAMPIRLLDQFSRSGITDVVIDLSAVDVLHGGDAAILERVAAMCSLSGIRCVAAAMKAHNAAILIHFVDAFDIDFELNVDRAIHALRS